MSNRYSKGNNNNADWFDYIFAIFGIVTTFILLVLIFNGGLSFLWYSSGGSGRFRGIPGILVLVLTIVMAYYPLKKIFRSNKEKNGP